MVFSKWVLYFFDMEHTVTYFLSHQRMPVLVNELLFLPWTYRLGSFLTIVTFHSSILNAFVIR